MAVLSLALEHVRQRIHERVVELAVVSLCHGKQRQSCKRCSQCHGSASTNL